MLAQRDVSPDRIRSLRRVEYEALVAQGLFDDVHVELLLGALVEMSPQGPYHAEIVTRLAEYLVRHLPETVRMRVQSALAVADDSAPEPDIAVVSAADYSKAHPAHALLVIEVAETSLQKDRGIKAALYAAAGVPEFWLVDLLNRQIEVHKKPATGRYEDIRPVSGSEALSPEAFPAIQIVIEELFA